MTAAVWVPETRRTNVRWVVTAGVMDGTCRARFVFYHNGTNERWAEFKIENAI